jgi:hypothetical protein
LLDIFIDPEDGGDIFFQKNLSKLKDIITAVKI